MDKTLDCKTDTREIILEEYSEKSFVLRGATKTFGKDLKAIGGRWNPHLKGGAAWIFSNKRLDQVKEYMKTSGINYDQVLDDKVENAIQVEEKAHNEDVIPETGRLDESSSDKQDTTGIEINDHNDTHIIITGDTSDLTDHLKLAGAEKIKEGWILPRESDLLRQLTSN